MKTLHLLLSALLFSQVLVGQRLVKELTPGSAGTFMSYYGNTKNGFIFSVYTNEYGIEPWVSNGTANGTKLLKDIVDGPNGSMMTDYYYSNDSMIFFVAYENGKYKLWRTDGTSNGTIKLFDFESNPPVKYYDEGIICNGKFYFNHPHGGKNSLWSTDGSVAGTQLVYQFNDSGTYARISLNQWKGELIFFAGDKLYGMELWRSDGTTQGTRMIKDIYPGAVGSVQLNRTRMAEAGGRLFFAARSSEEIGDELYVTDGTEEGTELFFNIEPNPYYHSSPQIVQSNDSFFLFNTQGNLGKAWKSDGTLSNTKLILDTGKDSLNYTWVYNATPFKDGYLLYLYTTEFSAEPYICDKNFNNIKILKDINPGSNSSFISDKFYQRGSKSYFLAANNMLGNDIWITDGTYENTLVYLELLTGNSGAENLFEWNGRLFYIGTMDLAIGNELYELNIENTGITSTKIKTFSLYPNPVKAGHTITLSETECAFQLYNTFGQLVLEGHSTDGKCLIPEQLPTGLYTLSLISDQTRQTTKLNIE
ncbi:MAG: T9SS type A sorting domain-containing protein [Chitinophagaceae bacterium]